MVYEASKKRKSRFDKFGLDLMRKGQIKMIVIVTSKIVGVDDESLITSECLIFIQLKLAGNLKSSAMI